MNDSTFFGRHRAKIGAAQQASPETQASMAPLNSHLLGPGELALGEWQFLGLETPDLPAIRTYRLERVRQQLRAADYAGIILCNPLNIRYATDSTNMQVWTAHNAVRYCFVATDGPVILFDFHGGLHLSDHLDLIDEVRPATAWYYMGAGKRVPEIAAQWAAELADLINAHGGGNQRIAIDQANHEGIAALQAHGLQIFNGEAIVEQAKVIKHPEEIKAMRCSIAACESAMRVMREKLEPGVTEQRLWSYLHAENIARGGEWIETRLLASDRAPTRGFKNAAAG